MRVMKRYRLLVVSDTHIPERASSVPPEAEKLIEEQKPYDVVIHAGDLVSEDVLEWLKTLAPRHIVVQGNMDYLDLPERQTIELPSIRIGVVHGHQVRPRGNIEQLTTIAKRMGVHILVSGHTHSPFLVEYMGILHVNPGSLTGVWGGGGGSMKPSLAIIEVEDSTVKVTIYEREGTSMRPTKTIAWKPS